MKKLITLMVTLLLPSVAAAMLSSCGGGGANVNYLPPAATQQRTDLFFGYYVTDETVSQVADHVNIVHESGASLQQTIADMQAGRKPTLLGVEGEMFVALDPKGERIAPNPNIEAGLTATFDALRGAGVLSQVVALYPADEPEVHGLDDQQVTSVNTIARTVMARYPELANTKIAVTYTSKGALPGFASYDWIGMDDYDPGAGVLVSGPWQQILARLTPSQRVFIVPGGASPWMQDPEAFVRYAEETPQCVGILTFVWRDWDGHTGVANNGMAETYRAAGRRVIGS